jgi:hypothetical protein
VGTLILDRISELALIVGAMAVTTGIGFLALRLVLLGIGQKLRPRV